MLPTKPLDQPPRLLFSVEEVAKMLNVGRNTVYNLIAPRKKRPPKMHSVLVGRHRRISMKAIQDFIDSELG
jgi:excisionase family DNA binding protein